MRYFEVQYPAYYHGIYYKLVVYQVTNVKVPHHYANMVRLCLGSVAIRPAKKKPLRSRAHDVLTCVLCRQACVHFVDAAGAEVGVSAFQCTGDLARPSFVDVCIKTGPRMQCTPM